MSFTYYLTLYNMVWIKNNEFDSCLIAISRGTEVLEVPYKQIHLIYHTHPRTFLVETAQLSFNQTPSYHRRISFVLVEGQIQDL